MPPIDLTYVSGWDVSSVKDMAFMFRGATAFNRSLSGWNTASLQDTKNMFFSASTFNQDVSGFDMTNIERMSFMFFYAADFENGGEPDNLENWKDSCEGKTMADMFTGSAMEGNEPTWYTSP